MQFTPYKQKQAEGQMWIQHPKNHSCVKKMDRKIQRHLNGRDLMVLSFELNRQRGVISIVFVFYQKLKPKNILID